MLLVSNIQSHSLALFAVVLLLVLGILLCSRSIRYWFKTEYIRPVSIQGTFGSISMENAVLDRKTRAILYGVSGLFSLGLGIIIWTGLRV